MNGVRDINFTIHVLASWLVDASHVRCINERSNGGTGIPSFWAAETQNWACIFEHSYIGFIYIYIYLYVYQYMSISINIYIYFLYINICVYPSTYIYQYIYINGERGLFPGDSRPTQWINEGWYAQKSFCNLWWFVPLPIRSMGLPY